MIDASVQVYRMHDQNPRGVLETTLADAPAWNAQGFGIFWSVNSFRGARRIENLRHINAWAVDIDNGTKGEQLAKIRSAPLVPTQVVEVKRGFHVYFAAKDATAETWNAIVLHRLVPFYGADKNARDLSRILRVPGFLHLKDPADPFMVRLRWLHAVAYTTRQMAEAYPDRGRHERDRETHAIAKQEHAAEGGTFWDRVWSLDCEQALERLSGHAAVGGERFTFRQNRRGTKNIYCDGKGTSAWVDANGRIGSLSSGGPSIYQWLRWYGNSARDAIDVIKQIFPEVGQ